MKKKKKVGIPFRTLLALLAVALLFGGAIGGTMAWLTSKSSAVTNTFTVGDIEINLWEHKYDPKTNTLSYEDDDKVIEIKDYKIVPGVNLPKDPTVEVVGGSEACWLFVEITESTNWPDSQITYELNDGWTKLENVSAEEDKAVYYREVSYSEDNQEFEILKGQVIENTGNYKDQIKVSEELTKDQLQALDGNISLTFKAFAIQKAGINDAMTAWEKINPVTP